MSFLDTLKDAYDRNKGLVSAVDPTRSDRKTQALVNFTGANHAIPVAYGECELPAIWVGFRQISKRQWCGLAVFCHAPIEEIEWVEVNGYRENIVYSDYPRHTRQDFDDKGVWFRFLHTGDNDDSYPRMFGTIPENPEIEGTEFPPPTMELPAGKTEPRFFTGLVGAEFKFDVKKGLVTGIPQVVIKVKGRNCLFDPRVDASPGVVDTGYYWLNESDFINGSTVAACTNPALIKADYLTNPHYGKGIPWSQINIDALIDAANICDTQVPDGDGANIPLMEFAGILDPDKKVDENLSLIDKHARMHSPFHNGTFNFVIRDDAATPHQIPEKWIKSFGAVAFGEKSKRLNRCIVSYPEPLYDLEENSVIWPAGDSQIYADYLTEDGEELTEEITLEGCRNRYQAIDYAESVVRESRLQKTTSLELHWPAIKYMAGDVVDVPLRGIGVTRMRIISVRVSSNHTIKWQLREHSNDAYPWSTKPSIPLPPKDLQNPVNIGTVSTLVFTPDATNDKTAGRLTWDDIENPFLTGYAVIVRNTDTGRVIFSAQVDEPTVDIPTLITGNYSASVRATTSRVNGIETLVAFTIMAPTIGDITGLTLQKPFTGRDCLFKWNAPANAVFTVHEYVVRILNSSDDSLIYEVRTKNTDFNYTYDLNAANGLTRTFKISVHAEGRYGQDNAATGAAVLVASNPLPALLNGVKTSATAEQIRVEYKLPADSDFKAIKVWLNTVSGVSPVDGQQAITTKNNQVELNGLEPSKTYYIQYGVLDAFHDETDTGVLSGEIVAQTAADAEKQVIAGIDRLTRFDEKAALEEILAADRVIINRRENKSNTARILDIELIQDDYAGRLVLVEQEQSSAGVLLEALTNNGTTQANAALYVDVNGAIAGVFTSANSTTSELVFKADVFKFKGATQDIQPFAIDGDRIKFDGEINIDSGSVIITDQDVDLTFHRYKMTVNTEGQLNGSEAIGGVYIKSEGIPLELESVNASYGAIIKIKDGKNGVAIFEDDKASYVVNSSPLTTEIQYYPTGIDHQDLSVGVRSASDISFHSGFGKIAMFLRETTLSTFPNFGMVEHHPGWLALSDADGIWMTHRDKGNGNGYQVWTNIITGAEKLGGASTNRSTTVIPAGYGGAGYGNLSR